MPSSLAICQVKIAQAHPDLRSGQPDSVGGVHGLEHVGHEGADLVVDDLGTGSARWCRTGSPVTTTGKFSDQLAQRRRRAEAV
jgi:hypothetical protein